MENPLVVTDPSDKSPEVIREAAKVAEAVDAPLTVLTVVSEDEYSDDASILGTIGSVEGASYEVGPQGYAKEVAQSAISDLLTEFDIETEAVGRAVSDDSERATAILNTAEEYGNDYIYLLGQRRSPAGKVVFGDTAQSVILNFDGYVVTQTE